MFGLQAHSYLIDKVNDSLEIIKMLVNFFVKP